MASRFNARSRRSPKDPDELNITPIMNVFMILVPFLLLTAVFAQNTMVDLSLPAASDPTEVEGMDEQESVSLRVTVREDGYQIDGNVGALAPIPRHEEGPYDLEQLGLKLAEIKGVFPDERRVIVAATKAIRYQDVVHVLDQCKKSGFGEIAIGQPE